MTGLTPDEEERAIVALAKLNPHYWLMCGLGSAIVGYVRHGWKVWRWEWLGLDELESEP